jgi:nitroimidazol reductase NimA-like FMN-containing flavoprotein (pyridoxamine 5'-phosphate oxidase superfamily)
LHVYRHMTPPTDALAPAVPFPKALTVDACNAVLERSCFGHLAFARDTHVDMVPIRFAFVEGWLYFRAGAAIRDAIGHNPWIAISVTDMLDETHFASVIARGACYQTERTGSAVGDAAALRGIKQLRDRVPVSMAPARRSARDAIVLRMHVDDLRGGTTFVPCPADAHRAGTIDSQQVREREVGTRAVRDDATPRVDHPHHDPSADLEFPFPE